MFNIPFFLFIFVFYTEKKRVKALNLSTSLTAVEKEQCMTYMAVDYMSSEHSISESEATSFPGLFSAEERMGGKRPWHRPIDSSF